MKYLVDEALCCGHGICALVARELFELDEDGLNTRRGELVAVPESLEEGAREGERNCPDAAIRLFD